MTDSVEDLSQKLGAFAKAREWEQFHSPKNLAAALIVEAGELLEHFQWMSEDSSRKIDSDKKAAVEDEIADVFLYLVRLADQLNIDLIAVAEKKLERNDSRYPVALARGNSRKHNEL